MFNQLSLTVQVAGNLVLNGERVRELDIIPDDAHQTLNNKEAVIVCCGCYDPINKIVYANTDARAHAHLRHRVERLTDSSNQTGLGDFIYGFVLSGGYFVNRVQASRHVIAHWPALTSKRLWVPKIYFNSEMIDWRMVDNTLRRLHERDPKQSPRALEVWAMEAEY